MSKRLLLIDALNLVRRVYEANPAPSSDEKAQAFVKPCLGSLRRALREHEHTHRLAAFDAGGATWRHDIHPEYRKSRKPMPVELKQVLPQLIDEFRQMGVATVQVPGVEADDVVATACVKWCTHVSGEVVILSTDKDLVTLSGPRVRVYDHFAGRPLNDEWCLKKFGVPTAQLRDLLALMGDSVDDIPGIPDVGPKKAAKLLAGGNGTLDGVIANASTFTGALGQALRDNLSVLAISRQLVALKTDLDIGLTLRDMAVPA